MKLFTHHHFGWRSHSAGTGPGDDAAILLALVSTHGFLADYEGRYRTEIERMVGVSYDGRVYVYWDDPIPHLMFDARLAKGDLWFKAFEFNFADDFACRFCGGTGVDHYVGPFCHCWACDGTKKQVRDSMPRDFKHKPTVHASHRSQEEYAQWKAARPA